MIHTQRGHVTIPELARTMGCCISTVRNWLRYLGIQAAPRPLTSLEPAPRKGCYVWRQISHEDAERVIAAFRAKDGDWRRRI